MLKKIVSVLKTGVDGILSNSHSTISSFLTHEKAVLFLIVSISYEDLSLE